MTNIQKSVPDDLESINIEGHYKLVPVGHKSYFHYDLKKYLNTFKSEFIGKLKEEKEKEAEKRYREELLTINPLMQLFSPPKKELPSEDYWKGVEDGYKMATNKCQHIYSSEGVSKEELHDLCKYLADNNLELSTNHLGSLIVTKVNTPISPKTYIEYKLEFEYANN